jgi:hypothetical protein
MSLFSTSHGAPRLARPGDPQQEPLLPLATLPRDRHILTIADYCSRLPFRHRDAIYVSALPLAELLFIMNDSRSSPLRAIHITKISPPVIIPVRSASGTGRLQLERLSATEMWPGVWRQDRTRRWCRFRQPARRSRFPILPSVMRGSRRGRRELPKHFHEAANDRRQSRNSAGSRTSISHDHLSSRRYSELGPDVGTAGVALARPNVPPARVIRHLEPNESLDHSGRKQQGRASYYAPHLANRRMADGGRFNPNSNVAASRSRSGQLPR